MPKSKRAKRAIREQPHTLLIMAGLVLLLITVFALKSVYDSPTPATPLESELGQALAAKHPTFVFLHSLDCIPCKAMMKTVADVYPEYESSVVLIDVDIYKESNSNIIQRERLQSIPTLVFYDAQGTRQIFIGAMEPEQFRDTLTQLAGGH